MKAKEEIYLFARSDHWLDTISQTRYNLKTPKLGVLK